MAEVSRLSAQEIGEEVKTGATLLVCAYSDDRKFEANHLDGAIPLSEFKVRLPDLDKDTRIVFYCA